VKSNEKREEREITHLPGRALSREVNRKGTARKKNPHEGLERKGLKSEKMELA